ncbi:MAG: GTP cyclohydrolase FolE2 [Armatimonadota bacterium]|nr:GTP cyclohydrolase FolE2 [Armatimonadota bacterium]
MKDIAISIDKRGVQIQRVGIKDLHVPLQIKERQGGFQHVLGNVSLSVELPHRYRGTHLSRLVETVFQWRDKPLSGREVRQILNQVGKKLDAEQAHMTVKFKYFVPKAAPVSHSESALDYDCEFTGAIGGDGFDFILGVEVPVTTLCPCSREISEYGAHNQRSIIRVRMRCARDAWMWIEDLVSELERLGSSEVYPMLKRRDEKYVTEKAYLNPKFVEDVLRDVILFLRSDKRVLWYEAECENFESIHNHSAYAYQCESRQDCEQS